MSKNCPKCENELPDNAKFCSNCGYKFEIESNSTSNSQPSSINNQNNSNYQESSINNPNNSNIFNNGKIFLILIFLVIIIGGGIILISTGNSLDNKPENVTLTITDVGGFGEESYILYTEALFDHVPSNLDGYNIKTSYYDDNNTLIGSENEKLKSVYHDSEYSLSFGYYTSYKKPNPKYVTVEIIKEGSTVNQFKYEIDRNKIEFLN